MGWTSANAENASFPAFTLRGLNQLESPVTPSREMGKRQEEKDHQSCEAPERSEGKRALISQERSGWDPPSLLQPQGHWLEEENLSVVACEEWLMCVEVIRVVLPKPRPAESWLHPAEYWTPRRGSWRTSRLVFLWLYLFFLFNVRSSFLLDHSATQVSQEFMKLFHT